MRVLHIAPSYLPAVRYGGPIFAIHSLCRALVSRGHEVHVMTTNINGSEDSDVPIGVTVSLDGVLIKYFSSKFLRRLAWAPSLANALKQEIGQFDLLHLHSVFLWPTWAAARLARHAHVPYLISPRGMLVKGLIERRNQLAKMAWIHLIEKSNLRSASAIHVTSELEAAELVRFKWLLPKIVAISNGVDEVEDGGGFEVSADVKAIALHQPLVLYFGRISWKKGIDRLLTAFARTDSATLAIVGTDDEGLVPELRRLAARLQIENRVRFLPRTVVGPDKEHLFAAARLFVLPSFSENFGNTVLEAMQRCVPIVVTPEVGAAQIVSLAGAGLVANSDPEALSEAMSRLLNDTSLALSMGKAGRRYVQEHCSWLQVASEMEQLYQSIVL